MSAHIKLCVAAIVLPRCGRQQLRMSRHKGQHSHQQPRPITCKVRGPAPYQGQMEVQRRFHHVLGGLLAQVGGANAMAEAVAKRHAHVWQEVQVAPLHRISAHQVAYQIRIVDPFGGHQLQALQGQQR